MTGGGQKSMWTQPRIDLRFLNNLSLSKLLPNLYYSDLPNPNTKSKLKLSFPNLFAFVSNSVHSIILISPRPRPRPRPPPPPQLPLPSPRPQNQIQKPTLDRRFGSESEPGCSLPLFRPYVAKVPWHGGVRGFLSQMFPRYGHYCGPNWSSGKDKGSMLWDQRPIDWLDFCCYCHDIGYDTHDQSNLLKADLAFLDCLEKPRMATKGGAHLALLYRSMCIAGLRHVLIPYRTQLVRMQSRPPLLETLVDFVGLSSRRGNNAYRQNSSV